jgi:hypothetical protein
MASRTIVLAGVAAVAIAGAAYWFLYMQEDAPPPPKVAATPAKPAVAAPKADAAPGTVAATPSPAGSPSPDELKAAQARVSDLEKTVVDLQSQIAMKNKAIAELENRLAKPAASR